MKKIEEASRAVAEAVKMCKPKVIPLYPITPQTHNVEALSEYVSNGELDATIINAESEHSAMSAAIGSSSTGVRTYTATSSQGLKYMSEMLFVASGLRLPIVMMVANRALSSPINIWNDHSDSMAERDSGWIQMYVESTQEGVDRMIQAFKISEQTLLPTMVCLDGFVLTHVYENVDMPEQEEVDRFLPGIQMPYTLDSSRPITMGPVGGPDHFFEIRVSQQDATLGALDVIHDVQKEYGRKFGRTYDVLEKFHTEDAERIIVCMGTICGTTREVVEKLREKGEKVGLLKLSLFRPFPREAFLSAIQSCTSLKELIVLDRALSTGNTGVLYTEIRDVLFDEKLKVHGYITGLGGRDVKREHIEQAFHLVEGQWLK